jgi:serpin B
LKRVQRFFFFITLTLILGTSAFTLAENRLDPAITTSEGLRSFGFSLFQKLRASGESPVAISPMSISEAITLAAAGAQGKTRTQLEDLFLSNLQVREGADLSVLTAGIKTIREQLDTFAKKSRGSFEYSSANSLWANSSPRFLFEFLPDFLKIGEKEFGATLETRDFGETTQVNGKSVNTTVRDINAWVGKKTKGKITQLIDSLSESDVAVILNAIYAKGKFKQHFTHLETGDYKLKGGKTEPATFMTKQEKVGYYSDKSLSAYSFNVEDTRAFLPEETNQIALDILVPTDGDTDKLVGNLTGQSYQEIVKGLRRTWMKVVLPSGKVEQANGAKLKTHLTEEPFLANLPFDRDNADFRLMGQTPNQSRLYVGEILTKASYELSPFGFEAAAATAVIISMRTAAPHAPVPPPTYRIDSESIHVIRHIPTGTPLFIISYHTPRLYEIEELKDLVEEGWKHEKYLTAAVDLPEGKGNIAAAYNGERMVLALVGSKGEIIKSYRPIKK